MNSKSLQVTTRCDVRQLADFAEFFAKRSSPARSLSEIVSRALELCHSLLQDSEAFPAPQTSTIEALKILEEHKFAVVNERTKKALLNQIRRETILAELGSKEQEPSLDEQLEILKQAPKPKEENE